MRISSRDSPSRKIWRHRIALVVMSTAAANAAGVEPVTAMGAAGFDDLPAISADELKELRGGFEFAGLKFDFAAYLRTFVDGRLALETLIKYTDVGTLQQHQLLPAQNTGGIPPPNAGTSGAEETVQVLGAGQGPSPAQLNLPGVDLSGLKDAAGILINDRTGAILALHEATRDRITSLVVNQATGRDIRQELNIDVTVENFRQFQETLRGTILNNKIGTTSSQY